MKHFIKISSLSIIVFLISLFITIPVLAIPTLPSSFYGTVKVNDANVPDGTVIQAVVGGQVYAEGFTQTYQGNSVYALDVPGDNTDTAAQDGAREGDTVQFKIGGVMTNQTALWHTGTNFNINLTASSNAPIITPQATPSPIPTQTAIVLIQPSLTPTAIGQASATPVIIVQPSQLEAQPAQPSQVTTKASQPSQVATKASQPSVPTLLVLSSQTPSVSGNTQDNGSDNIPRIAIIIVLVSALIIGYTVLTLRKKKI